MDFKELLLGIVTRTSNAFHNEHPPISLQILRLRHERTHIVRTERVVAVATDLRVFAALDEGRLLAGRFR